MLNKILRRSFSKQSKYSVDVVTENKYIYLNPKDHKHTMIFLHGLGDTSMGFYDLFLDSKNQFNLVPPNCKVVLPTAPIQPVSLNDGYEMNSWFDIFNTGQINTVSDLHERYC